MTPAGTMLSDAGTGAPGPAFVPCNGATYHPIALHNAGAFGGLNPKDYVRRAGWWAGAVGLGHFRIRVPLTVDDYWVNLCDDPAGPDPLPNGYTVMRPPPGTR